MHRISAAVEIDVPFHDVDAMNVAWHGHYIKYLEIARCAVLRLLDYDYPQMQESGYLWPIVDCHLKYIRPAYYGQRILVKATLAEYENRLKFVYEIRDLKTQEKLTKGSTVQVAVDAISRELQFVSPTALIERIEAFLCAR